MPSRLSPRAVFDALASTRVAIVLGFVACGLLAWASWVVPPPRSRDALPFSESFEAFFDPMKAEYWWFYLLFMVITLYAVNAILGTVRSWLKRRARGQLDRRFWGVTGMHLGLIGALFAHLFAGLSSGAEQMATLSDQPVTVAGRELSLVSYSPVYNPDGTLRTATAMVRVDGVDRYLAYNQPIFFDGFRRYLLLQGERPLPGATLALAVDGQAMALRPGLVIERPGGAVTIERISQGASLRFPMALAKVGQEPARWVAPGGGIAPGVQVISASDRVGLTVVLRRNDGVPVLFGSMCLFMGGLALFGATALRR